MAVDIAGTVAVVDLEEVCALYGRDALPSPLGRTRPVGSVWLVTRQLTPIEDRLPEGGTWGAHAWVQALVRADACVECRVSFADAGTPDIRLHALRAGDSGFVAIQYADQDGVDVVDIHSMPWDGVGAVISESVGLVGAGTHLRVAVTGRAGQLPVPPAVDEYDDFGFLIPNAEPRDTALRVVDGRDVLAIGMAEAWHTPERSWTGDTNRQVLQWVQVIDDGDYLYAPGGAGYAEPMDVGLLRMCIDRLIAE